MIRSVAMVAAATAFLGLVATGAKAYDDPNAAEFRHSWSYNQVMRPPASIPAAPAARGDYPTVIQSALPGAAQAGDDNAPGGGQIVDQTTSKIVPDPTGEKPGTVTIDTTSFHLYLSQPGGKAIEYTVGVGREGYLWHGRAHIGRKAEWPTWTPPVNMLKRRPSLPKVMAGGIDNPLGARALYLYDGTRDTEFRIHGTNDPSTVGESMSSGCIRMLNTDVMDLYSRVPVGAAVNVIGNTQAALN